MVNKTIPADGCTAARPARGFGFIFANNSAGLDCLLPPTETKFNMKTRIALPLLLLLLVTATGVFAQDDDMSSMGSMSADMPGMDSPANDMPAMDTPESNMPSMDTPSDDIQATAIPSGDARDVLGDRAQEPDGTPDPSAGNTLMQTGNAGSATMTIPSGNTTTTTTHSHSSSSNFSVGVAVPVGDPNAPAVYGTSVAGRGGSCSAPPNHQCRGCSVSCPAGQVATCTQGDRGIFTEAESGICQTEAKCECQ